uniref:NADH dehydrogenase [ubiquinone] 1 beta subcomplex subunit 9 n=1 Tax=Salmo salar TaxID=8030 RepID=B5XD39_SALSA|nr:NADH dehydrogenase 1 beta subcomplex subunit 9 [Salmo salar]
MRHAHKIDVKNQLIDKTIRIAARYRAGVTKHRTRSSQTTAGTMSSRRAAISLYRRSLKLALDWAVQHQLWRGQALYIRSLFEANRNIADSRQQRALLSETEKLLDTWKHPDPYVPPTAPGGSKYERNLPSPILDPPSHQVNRH